LRGAYDIRKPRQHGTTTTTPTTTGSNGTNSIIDIGVAVYSANYTLRTGLGTAQSLMDFLTGTFFGYLVDDFSISARRLPTPAPTPTPTGTPLDGDDAFHPSASDNGSNGGKPGSASGNRGNTWYENSSTWAYVGAAAAVVVVVAGWVVAARVFRRERGPVASPLGEPDLESGDVVEVYVDPSDIDLVEG
jgi:hypothetical protein